MSSSAARSAAGEVAVARGEPRVEHVIVRAAAAWPVQAIALDWLGREDVRQPHQPPGAVAHEAPVTSEEAFKRTGRIAILMISGPPPKSHGLWDNLERGS